MIWQTFTNNKVGFVLVVLLLKSGDHWETSPLCRSTVDTLILRCNQQTGPAAGQWGCFLATRRSEMYFFFVSILLADEPSVNNILHTLSRKHKIANKWPLVSFKDGVGFSRFSTTNFRMSTWHAASIQLTCLVANLSFGFFAPKTLKDQGARINILLHSGVDPTTKLNKLRLPVLGTASECPSDSMLRLLSLTHSSPLQNMFYLGGDNQTYENNTPDKPVLGESDWK